MTTWNIQTLAEQKETYEWYIRDAMYWLRTNKGFEDLLMDQWRAMLAEYTAKLAEVQAEMSGEV